MHQQPCILLLMQGRQHPVDILYAPSPEDSYMDAALQAVLQVGLLHCTTAISNPLHENVNMACPEDSYVDTTVQAVLQVNWC